MKLNLGCGFNRLADCVNVDREPLCAPDAVVDLEHLPWPWADGSVTEFHANHVLEHLGATTELWLGIMAELWRVGTPDALVHITVPHPRHDNFLHDPTHVRVVTPIGLAMFDQTRNLDDLAHGGQETKLGLMTGLDFEVREVGYDLCDPWRTHYVSGELTRQQVEHELAHKTNVCMQMRITLRIVKPARGEAWLTARRAASLRQPSSGV